MTLCIRTLCSRIDQGLLRVRNIDLPLKVKRRQSGKGHPPYKRLYRPGIDEQPEEITVRESSGHWEIDTVTGRRESSAALLTTGKRIT